PSSAPARSSRKARLYLQTRWCWACRPRWCARSTRSSRSGGGTAPPTTCALRRRTSKVGSADDEIVSERPAAGGHLLAARCAARGTASGRVRAPAQALSLCIQAPAPDVYSPHSRRADLRTEDGVQPPRAPLRGARRRP